MLISPSVSHKTRLLLCILWESCCIRPVRRWILLPLWGSVSHSRGRRNNRGHVSQWSLLSSGLLNATAVSRGTLQQQNQKCPSLRLPALSSRFDLYWIFIHLGFNGETIDMNTALVTLRSLCVHCCFHLLFRTPVCHQRALFPFSYLSGWFLLSRRWKRRPAGVDPLLAWKHVPARI